jgi:hypothetical protein
MRSVLALIALGSIHVVDAFAPGPSVHASRHHSVLRAASASSAGDSPRLGHWRQAAESAALGLRCSAAAYATLRDALVVDPRTGSSASILAGLEGKRALVVLAPQLGDFDSAEYAEQLSAVVDNLAAANIGLRIVGIGSAEAACKFSAFNDLPLDYVRVDPCAAVHYTLSLHAGPDWDIPSWAQENMSAENGLRARAWLNYMAMCAGLGSRGTLKEILRGYIGDRAAPERLPPDSLVEVGPISIMGTRRVKLGPVEYDQMWKDERGYQRPVELATVRLRNMVEVLSNWGTYVRFARLCSFMWPACSQVY